MQPETYIIRITCGLDDTKRAKYPDGTLPLGFIPRVGDTIIWENLYWDVRNVVIDYDHKSISVWVKDSERFK